MYPPAGLLGPGAGAAGAGRATSGRATAAGLNAKVGLSSAAPWVGGQLPCFSKTTRHTTVGEYFMLHTLRRQISSGTSPPLRQRRAISLEASDSSTLPSQKCWPF
ncbi:MAG TPA: hypothetical protein VGO93_15360 [Candidatus Xenobia bacterium]